MSRIRLAIIRGPHRPSLDVGHLITATRLVTRIGFALDQGWMDFDSVAIVDTGAPLSLFPQAMWTNIARQTLATVMVGGVAEKPECRFSADLAIVRCILSDGAATIGPFQMNALLAHNDKIPALLGLAGALEATTLTVRLRQDHANLDSP